MNIALGLVALSLLGAEQQGPLHISYRSVGPVPTLAMSNAPQTSYEVRVIEVPAMSWRPTLYKKCTRVDHQGISTVWTLDEQTVRELLEVCQKDSAANVTQMPKVTTFDTNHAEISKKKEVWYVSDVVRVAKIVSESGKGLYQPIVEKLTDGLELKLETQRVGTIARLGVVIRSSWVGKPQTIPSHDVNIDDQGNSIAVNSSMQLPQVTEASVKGTYNLIEGQHLLVSLGSNIGTTSWNRPVVMERVVLIAPRRIVPDSEEGASVQKTTFEAPKPLPQVATTTKLPTPPLPSRSLLRAVGPNGQVVELPALPDAQVQTTSIHTVPAPQASAQATVVVRPSTSEAPQMGQLMRIDPNVAPAKFEPLPVGTSELLRPHSLTITPSVEPQTIRIPLGGNLAIEIKASVKK